MKAIRSAGSVRRPRLAARPFYFCRSTGREGEERFNFAPAIAGPAMRCTRIWTPGLLVLAASMLILSHPHWLAVLGRRRSGEVARELAWPFASEYLIPHCDRDWIISSYTVREFVAETLDRIDGSPATNPHVPARLRGGDVRGSA